MDTHHDASFESMLFFFYIVKLKKYDTHARVERARALQVEADLANEGKAMDEYTSWCDEEANEKEDAITSSKRTIGDLEATITDAKATIGSLTSSIDELTSKISSSAGVLSSITT